MVVLKFFLTMSLIFFSSLSWSKGQSVYNEDGIAIDGYDVVSYIENKQAQKGLEKFQTNFKKNKYYFSSKKHQELFERNPQKYLPAYGSWCAWAMAEYNDLVEVDPKAFLVTTDEKGRKRTFLFYNGWLGNTLKKWNNKAKGSNPKETQRKQFSLIQKADGNWSSRAPK